MTASFRLGTVQAAAARNGPIIVPDTCCLLDIVRAPVRPEFREGDGRVIAKLLALTAEGAAGATIVVTEQVRRELDVNIEAVTDATRTELRDLSEKARAILRRMSWLGDAAKPEPIDLHGLGHPDIGRAIVQNLLACSLDVADCEDAMRGAGTRVTVDMAPASRGKQSFKDCLVIETTLRFAAECRENGIDAPIVFLSANTADYCLGRKLRLRPPLDDDFARIGIEFQPCWAALHRYLG